MKLVRRSCFKIFHLSANILGANEVQVESPHPYENNRDVYTVVEMSGATGYTVTFDEQSSTEQNYRYVRFYRSDDQLEFWGEDKYSGRYQGSSKNFPGTGGRPALTIPADRFVVRFHSDGYNTDWGYTITVTKSTVAPLVGGPSKYLQPLYFDFLSLRRSV